MTPAEKKARDAVVRAAKRLISAPSMDEKFAAAMNSANRALARLQREDAKRKEKRRGK